MSAQPVPSAVIGMKQGTAASGPRTIVCSKLSSITSACEPVRNRVSWASRRGCRPIPSTEVRTAGSSRVGCDLM